MLKWVVCVRFPVDGERDVNLTFPPPQVSQFRGDAKLYSPSSKAYRRISNGLPGTTGGVLRTFKCASCLNSPLQTPHPTPPLQTPP